MPWSEYPAGISSLPQDILPHARHVPTLSPEIGSCNDKPDDVVPAEDREAPAGDGADHIPKLWRPFEVQCVETPRAFRCFCGSAFARNEELTRHLRIHSGQRPFECGQCGRRFGRKDHRDKHLKTHLRNEYKRIHRCPVAHCPGRYTRTDALNRHMLAAHGFRRPRKRATQDDLKDQEVPALTVPKNIMLPTFHLPLLNTRFPCPAHLQGPGPPPAITPLPRPIPPGPQVGPSLPLRTNPPKFDWPLPRDFQRLLLRNEIYNRSQLELWLASRHRMAYLNQAARESLLGGTPDKPK